MEGVEFTSVREQPPAIRTVGSHHIQPRAHSGQTVPALKSSTSVDSCQTTFSLASQMDTHCTHV